MGNCILGYRNFRTRRELQTTDFSSLKKFTFAGIDTWAKVVDVYDGDTITIVFKYHGIFIKDNFRMLGYDSPEIKPKLNMDHRQLHIDAAKIAKRKLEDLILNRVVRVVFDKEEKFGRLMGTVYTDKICVNDWMVASGLAVPYKGKKKVEFSHEQLQKITKM